MNIIHLTDLHFDSQTRLPALITAFNNSDLMESIDPENTYLLITGDVATKGRNNSYQFALPFIEKVFIDTRKIKPSNIILCPGNHDLASNGLHGFNEFSRSIRDDNAFTFGADNVILKKVDDIYFCSLNSMYQSDRGHSNLNLDELIRKMNKEKRTIEGCKHRVAILHHHLIGVEEGDSTAVQNALPFLEVMENYGFKLVLHGHQHVHLNLNINNIQIMSGYSLLSQSEFLGNGFNKISYDEAQDIFTKETYELTRNSFPVGQLNLRKVV
ncbi:metallophosphoesterase family protein [Acinetobacter lactucae]|uniref:metallophosphoesterase family protein n=1 Tax=Acinetobacter lactucae TaxID=1785128 RepID=UPI00148D9865|nr:metallophosphoesterase [Acinetobacter lactucae]